MKQPSEIIINGKPLSDILEDHRLWRQEPAGKEIHKKADLRWANLQGASLRWADMQEADLRGASLQGADLDFSCWPLWCGSKGVKVDRKIAAQLAAHFCVLDCDDPDYIKARDAIMEFAKTSHRAEDLELL